MIERVLVLWSDDSSSNLGVRVLSDGAETLVKRAWGDKTIVEFQSFEPGPLGTQLSGKVVVQGLLTNGKFLRTALSGYDAVLDTGAGDSFTDIYGLKRLIIMAYTRYIAKKAGVPVIFSPQTLGPFNTFVGKAIAQRSLRDAEIVMARDSASRDFSERMGAPADVLATDVAFALPQLEPNGQNSADVVLNVSGLLWNSDSHLPQSKYREFIRSLISELLSAGRSVTLLAHVLDNDSIDNDVSTVHSLAAEFDHAVATFIPQSLADVRQFIANSNIVIGARMHACLNALSLGVPAIPLAYSRKFAPLLADIGWPYTVELRTDGNLVSEVLERLEDKDLSQRARAVRRQAEARLDSAVMHLSEHLGVKGA